MTQAQSDLDAHRAWVVGLTGAFDEGLVVDFGCGHGEELRLLPARQSGTAVRFVGVDASPENVGAASAALAADQAAGARVRGLAASVDGARRWMDGSPPLERFPGRWAR